MTALVVQVTTMTITGSKSAQLYSGLCEVGRKKFWRVYGARSWEVEIERESYEFSAWKIVHIFNIKKLLSCSCGRLGTMSWILGFTFDFYTKDWDFPGWWDSPKLCLVYWRPSRKTLGKFVIKKRTSLEQAHFQFLQQGLDSIGFRNSPNLCLVYGRPSRKNLKKSVIKKSTRVAQVLPE